VIIIVKDWRRKLVNVTMALVVILAFTLLFPRLMGLMGNNWPVFSGWLKDESPSGNPMRVENREKTNFDRAVDQFVIKLQNFYYKETE